MNFFNVVICITLLQKIKSVQSIDGDCTAQCFREDNTICSDVFYCNVTEYDPDELQYTSKIIPNITNQSITLICDRSNRLPRIGFKIAWKMKGHDIWRNKIDRFWLEVYNPSDSAEIDTSKFINIPGNLPQENNIKFIYFSSTPIIQNTSKIQGGRYNFYINIDLMDYTYESLHLGFYHVPVYLDEDLEACQNRPKNSTDLTTPPTPPGKKNSLLFIAIGLGITLFVILVLIITFKIYCIPCKHKETYSSDSEMTVLLTNRNANKILVLCNPGVTENMEWKESVMRIPTKLSDNLKHVAFNWTEQQSGETFIDWLQRKMSWANMVVIISVPDNYEVDDATFELFNNTVKSALYTRYNDAKDIIVAYQDNVEKHSKCPFLCLDYVKKLSILQEENSWNILYKFITGNDAMEENGITNRSTHNGIPNMTQNGATNRSTQNDMTNTATNEYQESDFL